MACKIVGQAICKINGKEFPITDLVISFTVPGVPESEIAREMEETNELWIKAFAPKPKDD